ASYHETRQRVRPCFSTFFVVAIYFSLRRGECGCASMRTNRATGSAMRTSSRSHLATEFQCTPRRSANCLCVSPRVSRILRSCGPVMGWTIQTGYIGCKALESRYTGLRDIGAKVTEPDPYALPRQAHPRQVGGEMAHLQERPGFREGEELIPT